MKRLIKKQSIIIVGAGACGLVAAKKLSKHLEVIVLEAADRPGGRIHSITWGNDVIEAGAEFLHGDVKVTKKILKQAGVPYDAIHGTMYRKENGFLTKQDEMIEGWDKLLIKMKKIKKECTLLQFLEEYYPGNENEKLRKHVIGYASGFDLADPADAEVSSLYEEWSAGDEESYRLPAGYKALIEYLERKAIKNGCNIQFNKRITSVKWQKNKITVYTDGKEEFIADKLLVTVPVSLLQKKNREIKFEPPLDQYMNAAENIGFGAIIKAIIKFRQPFWHHDTSFVFSNEKIFPTWWTLLPGKAPILTGWIGGPEAAVLSSETNEAILQKAYNTLSAVFNKTPQELQEEVVQAEIFNWQADRSSFGGYSYSTIHSSIAKKILNTPVSDTIFFAGEGLYSGIHPGTVEAALISGSQVAKRIKKSVD